jgi:hypothetical protein
MQNFFGFGLIFFANRQTNHSGTWQQWPWCQAEVAVKTWRDLATPDLLLVPYLQQ